MKRIVVIPDLQIPFHDRRALKNVIQFVGEYQPDLVLQIGDLMDYPAPSRWTTGTRLEFAGGVIRESEIGKKEFLGPLRDVYSGPLEILEGNHDERPRVYLAQRAPALSAEDEFYRFENLLDFKTYEVSLRSPFKPLAPGWTAMHGHEMKGFNSISGRTAAAFAKKLKCSVVMGHTHRLAISPESGGIRHSTRYGFEAGHLMDMKQASYLRGGPANWQMGFGILYVLGPHVQPTPVDIASDGSFIVEGQAYGKKQRAG
ncbi:metallophosphoesterase [Streptomyces sp. NPDC087850]|uniref:metallophosphoesterase n=1 Tax=Streptomyces sp. NPDC087850 TaxID=3365809 RepID=UPI003804EF2D